MRRLAIILLTAAAGLGLLAPPAGASGSDSTDTGASTEPVGADEAGSTAAEDLAPVNVVQVSGLIDEILIDKITTSLAEAETDGSQAVVLQINSPGAVVSRSRMTDLAEVIKHSPMPVGIWVGPSGARLTGLGGQLLAVADATGMAPGAHIGKFGTPLTVEGVTFEFGTVTDKLRDHTIGFQEARTSGALNLDTTDEGVPAVKNMVLGMDGLNAKGRTLDTVTVTLADDGSTQNNLTLVRFFKLSLLNQLLHTVSSPAVAYLLFVIGLALLVFEFFTAGVGIAGVVGAVCVILACYGLGSLPTSGWAIAALIASMFAFAVDVQVGIPRLWTGIGFVLFVLGSWFLFRDVLGADLRPSWITLIAGIGGILLTFVVGMPSMVRTRFATPTVGREWMIGEMGTALASISPDGIAQVAGGRWRARTNRATPLQAGDRLRVVAIDGVTLEVEPEEGGAKDYREMRKKRGAADAATSGAEGESANAPMAKYWTELGGPHWVAEQRQFDTMLAGFHAESQRVLAAAPGERILDVGCGTATTTIAIAHAVGPNGSVVGCDISSTMIDAARARTSDLPQVSLMVGDAQIDDLAGGQPFDAVYSRFGVMFFADPVAAFTNIAAAVRPGGRLTFVCWQGEAMNDWIAVPARIMRGFVSDLEIPPPEAPGPFAFQDAARIERILLDAGWENPTVAPFSARAVMGGGDGVEAAVEHAMATRVALQLREQLDDDTFAEARAAVAAALADHLDADGAVSFDGNVWIVTATRP